MEIESVEKIKKPNKIKEVEDKAKQENAEIQKKSKKKFICNLVLIYSILLFIVISIFAVLFYIKIGKKEDKPSLLKEKSNSITALYSLKKEEELTLFNPEKIKLSKSDYEIEILSLQDENNTSISDSEPSLRRLKTIENKFTSSISGKIEIRITFLVQLTSMFELFKNCRNLIEVDLSQLDATKLKNVNSVFENCENLVFTNFTLKNGTNIESMEDSFSGCEKLKSVDLTDLTPQKNVSVQNMFKNCVQLDYVDLSNFQTNNFRGIFDGALNILINININIDLDSLINFGEIINALNKKKADCEIGEGKKCKSCMEGLYSQYCKDCNEGYYIPYEKRRTECIKCEENCLECFGIFIFSICKKCENGYKLVNGKCKKEENQEEEEEPLNHTPEIECDEGYYLPKDEKECKKCSMECCKECPNDKCILCYGEDVNYPELSLDEALKKVQDNESAPESYSPKIYYSNYYPSIKGMKVKIPDGRIYSINGKRHYVFHTYKRKMIELEGLYHISHYYTNLVIYFGDYGNLIQGEEYNNEYFQCVRQGYDFTCIDHIYQKNSKKYKYNDKTLSFDEIDENYEYKCDNNDHCILGEDEKCKTCDLNDTLSCGTCNEGYYLPEENKTECTQCSLGCCKECPNDECTVCNGVDVNYPELSLEEALKKVQEDIIAPASSAYKIYYSNFYEYIPNIGGKRHFVFHPYKRKMIELEGLYHISGSYFYLEIYLNNYKKCIGSTEYNNEYFQCIRQGYDFTCIDHIYQKNGKKYKYNDKTLSFDEIDENYEYKCYDKNQCNPDDINYPELSLEEALEKVKNDKLTPESNSSKIYYSNYFPAIPKTINRPNNGGVYYFNAKRHYVFNTYKRKMIELDRLCHISSNYTDLILLLHNQISFIQSEEYNNEYFQCVRQGYDFTCIDHIYQKNDKKYKYNKETLSFDEIDINIKEL